MANDQQRPIDHAGMEVLAGTECNRFLQIPGWAEWRFSRQVSPGCFPW